MHHSIRNSFALVPLALVLLAPAARGGEIDALPPAVRDANAQLLSQFFAQGGASPAVLEYRRKLAEYQAARAAFDAEAGAYWSQISEKRKGRNAKRRSGQQVTLDDYVLEHPPLYNGPKKPVNPEPEETPDRPAKKPIPVVADFLRAAQELYQFTPQRPASEIEFKRAYARYALASGLTREQAVRVYSFETGGTGSHDVQAGIEHGGKRAISTAMGYNQLLTTNSVELLAEQGHELIRALSEKVARGHQDRRVSRSSTSSSC
ncbi:hypothetical protein ABH970_004947 [Bradyrhizobium ottawaense]